MKLRNSKIMLIPYEPQFHAPTLYRWAHSQNCDSFFCARDPYSMQDCLNLNSKDNFVIVDAKNPDNVLGILFLRCKDERNRNIQLHAIVDEKYRGNGVAKESAKLLIYHVMNNMNFYKVVSPIIEGNDASEAAATSLGYEQEACLKHQVYVDGEFKNVKLFYMTKGMFNKLYKREVEEGI